MGDTLNDHGKSLAAPLVFLIVVAFQFLSRYLEFYKKVLLLVFEKNCIVLVINYVNQFCDSPEKFHSIFHPNSYGK